MRAIQIIGFGTAATLMIALVAAAVFVGQLKGRIDALSPEGVKATIGEEVDEIQEQIHVYTDTMRKIIETDLEDLTNKENERKNIHNIFMWQIELS